jgi:integrase
LPKLHFTTKGIDALKPSATQTDYFDLSVTGFSLRVSPKGTKTWNYVYRHEGRLRRLKLGRYPDLGLADARKHAEQARGDLAKNIDPAAGKDAARRTGSFGELAADYIEHAKRKKRTWQEDERVLNKDFLPRWCNRRLSDIRRREVRELIDTIALRGTGIIGNRSLTLIKTVFNFAVEKELIEVSPCALLKPPAAEKRRERVLSDDEIRSLWSAVDQQPPCVAPILRLQLLTAQRIGEVLTMSWADIDLASAWWTIPAERAKNGLPHRVPLSLSALTILETLKLKASSSWVFPATRNSKLHYEPSTLFLAVTRLRPLIAFRTHDLRHTAATCLAASKTPHVVLKRILNHRDRTRDVTARYVHHTYDAEARQALDAWARRLNVIIENKETGARVLPMAVSQK